MLILLPYIKQGLILLNHILIAILLKHFSHPSRHLPLLLHIPWESKRTTAKMHNKSEVNNFLTLF